MINKLIFCKLCLIVFGASLAVQSVSAGNWNKSKGEAKRSGVLINDDFEQQRLNLYDYTHIKKKSVEYIKENQNTFVRLTTTIGQLSHFNRGSKHIKDRIELGTPHDFLSESWADVDGKTLWYGFDVKMPPGKSLINGNEITISQLKTIEKDRKKKQCHPGMPFRINYRNQNRTWIAVTNGYNRKLRKIEYKDGFLTQNWTNFKVGYHFSKKKGWVEVIKDGKQIFYYSGNTLFDEYPKCKPVSDLQTFVRIGVYRSVPNKDTKDDSLDFDNYIVCKSDFDACPFKSNVAK